MRADDSSRDDVPVTWPVLVKAFTGVACRRLRKSFSAVRTLHAQRMRQCCDGPLVICLNHPSWWDPLVCLALAHALLPARRHYAPISSVGMRRYPFFARLGMFSVEIESTRGVAQFLRTSRAILRDGGVLWVTAQGRFADARLRPPQIRGGLGALLAAEDRPVTVLPLAIEYTFWNQPKPEVLLAVGDAVTPLRGDRRGWTAEMESALAETQNELAAAAMLRDAAVFETLMEGR